MSGKRSPFYDLVTHQPPYTPQQLRDKRIELMKQIRARRGRPMITYATNANISQPRINAYMHPEDIVPLSEVIDAIEGDAVDFLLETPGGLAEVAAQIVSLLRPRFREVAFIVPNMAMSAGTILVMSGDEILLDHRSALGPIDPQFPSGDGRPQAAQAMLAGIERIKEEAAKTGTLNPAYVPVLRNVDPGRLQSAVNASELSMTLVREWLASYKFRQWQTHSSSGQPVTDEERKARAREIAAQLCDHQKWLSHGRPIKIADCEGMRLKITDYGKDPELQNLIWSLWVNLHHIMTAANIYKVYESEQLDFVKIAVPQPVTAEAAPPAGPGKAIVGVTCGKCGRSYKFQCDFGARQPLDPGAERFPASLVLTCRQCGNVINLSGVKMQIEAQLRRPILTEKEGAKA